jgi:hypothetical protein
MRAQFQVIRDGDVIYRMDFPIDEAWKFDEFSRIAHADFHRLRPNVSLLDDDVIIKWEELLQ